MYVCIVFLLTSQDVTCFGALTIVAERSNRLIMEICVFPGNAHKHIASDEDSHTDDELLL